ncbi:ComF family protein [Sporomusa acidovorans]|uniref:Phosphoribosyltransferase domain-containing protein n=1 Tax=Sporomusa acidovorans (strain ATCC 49682 / DSM 3132 / Mol) TaxID=1123286 RepID=A0ABZ3J736_SPOA4|nr:ComF family protein [Sporomusa acidovorans]OZC19405.1 orotate phosphoribosyltransferase [Sporomusa acidovorans DSM 3132]SDD77661.1 comF family protein [Sporomusa acidovorans]
MVKAWWQALLALIFPARCPACNRWTDVPGWCPACIAQIAKPRQVALLLHKLRWLDECLTVTDYTGSVQRLIRDIKFRRMTRQAAKLSQLLRCAIAADRYGDIDYVVPVPLHAERLRERGFNQTERIFKPWSSDCALVWREALIRTRPTAPQWQLDLKQRRKNIKGAFAVTRPELIQEKRILLVDDIFTSGQTMEECAKVLKQAGAVTVKGLALASGAR